MGSAKAGVGSDNYSLDWAQQEGAGTAGLEFPSAEGQTHLH